MDINNEIMQFNFDMTVGDLNSNVKKILEFHNIR